MQIVIDIPNRIYKIIQNKKLNIMDAEILEKAIINGTPLPKGHGRLIDADELKRIIQENDILNMTDFNVRICDINATPTIIEADKEQEE